ncbi:MAG: domain S-box [Acidimicrobiales bacterium]|nr:domain S-box [Acidimicrobiales bacterium]
MVRDLVALSAIPAVWIGSESPAVVAGLADVLVGLLQLDFAFVRLSDPDGGGATEVTRGSAWTEFPTWLQGRLATSDPFPRKEVVPDIGDDSVRRCGFVVPVGVSGEGGVVAAASERSDFPTAREQLLLSLAANHAAAAFQTAALIHERQRAEAELRTARDELEVKVAERTAELRVANDELSALHRVATLVAEGVQPQDLFAVVAEEVARVVVVPLVSVVRYGSDGGATECASYSTKGPDVEPGRIDDDSQLEGENAEGIGRRGTSTVRVPIVVAGRVWGAMVVSTAGQDPLPDGAEARLTEFTELLATAIENAESREALGRLVEEQAALRRVATLVAQDVPPAEIFSAVVEEVGRLFGTDTAAVVRFEHDPPAIVVTGVGKSIGGIPLGTRSDLDETLASTEVYRTRRSARIDARHSPSPEGPIHVAARRLGLVGTVASPIIVKDRLWGAMSISATEPLPLDAEQRLENFTELVATAVANVTSRSELAASRTRIVAASDEARRRIERDLHDGAQQRLISLGLAVRAVEGSVPLDKADLRAELSRIATGLADAVADLQETSRGIHPAILSQGGLGPALRTLARRSPIPVQLDATTDARLPAPIEVAAYYVASEALANATKHAQASRIEVTLATRDDRLLLSIRDDGVGGADVGRGSGLVGLVDRVHALAGSIHVSSRPGHGTHITAELPVELEVERDPEQPVI